MTTDPARAGIMKKQLFLRSAENCFFWRKMHCIPKKHPKFLMRLIFIWEKVTFFFMARTCLGLRSGFCWARNLVFLPKNPIFAISPILVNGPFVALGETAISHLGSDFLTFRPRVTAVFVKKNPVDASKRLLPRHCEGTVCQ